MPARILALLVLAISLLFHGLSAFPAAAQTWREVATGEVPKPRARELHAMAFDGNRAVMVLLNGTSSGDYDVEYTADVLATV